MKTAMQELKEIFQTEGLSPLEFTMWFSANMWRLIDKEKAEKIDFALAAYQDISRMKGVPENLISENKIIFEEYYNIPSDEEIEEKANKIPIGKWETGVDEEGGYYIEPNTNEKWRWGGSMVGKGQSYILYNVEYIEKEAEKRFPYEKHMGDTWGNGLHEGFIIGAEWMKEKIFNQKK